MSDSTNGDIASELQRIKTAMARDANEGFESIGELVTKHHEALAELDRAEKARDKFATANDEASKIIGRKGAEHGEMLKQLEEVKGERDALQAKLDGRSDGEPTPKPQQNQPPVPPTKSVEEQLTEVEGSLTEEQWKLAGTLLSMVEDKDEAIALDEDPAKRLKFLSDLRSNKEIKEKPKAFTRKKPAAEPKPNGGETQVEQLLKQLTSVPHGPSGRVVAGGGSRSNQPQTDPRLH